MQDWESQVEADLEELEVQTDLGKQQVKSVTEPPGSFDDLLAGFEAEFAQEPAEEPPVDTFASKAGRVVGGVAGDVGRFAGQGVGQALDITRPLRQGISDVGRKVDKSIIDVMSNPVGVLNELNDTLESAFPEKPFKKPETFEDLIPRVEIGGKTGLEHIQGAVMGAVSKIPTTIDIVKMVQKSKEKFQKAYPEWVVAPKIDDPKQLFTTEYWDTLSSNLFRGGAAFAASVLPFTEVLDKAGLLPEQWQLEAMEHDWLGAKSIGLGLRDMPEPVLGQAVGEVASPNKLFLGAIKTLAESVKENFLAVADARGGVSFMPRKKEEQPVPSLFEPGKMVTEAPEDEFKQDAVAGFNTVRDFLFWVPLTTIELINDPVKMFREKPFDAVLLLSVLKAKGGKTTGNAFRSVIEAGKGKIEVAKAIRNLDLPLKTRIELIKGVGEGYNIEITEPGSVVATKGRMGEGLPPFPGKEVPKKAPISTIPRKEIVSKTTIPVERRVKPGKRAEFDRIVEERMKLDGAKPKDRPAVRKRIADEMRKSKDMKDLVPTVVVEELGKKRPKKLTKEDLKSEEVGAKAEFKEAAKKAREEIKKREVQERAVEPTEKATKPAKEVTQPQKKLATKPKPPKLKTNFPKMQDSLRKAWDNVTDRLEKAVAAGDNTGRLSQLEGGVIKSFKLVEKFAKKKKDSIASEPALAKQFKEYFKYADEAAMAIRENLVKIYEERAAKPKPTSKSIKPTVERERAKRYEPPEAKTIPSETKPGEQGWHRMALPDGTVVSIMAENLAEAKAIVTAEWIVKGAKGRKGGKIDVPEHLADKVKIGVPARESWKLTTVPELNKKGFFYTPEQRRLRAGNKLPLNQPGDILYRGKEGYQVLDVQRETYTVEGQKRGRIGDFRYKVKPLTGEGKPGYVGEGSWFGQKLVTEMFTKEPGKDIRPKGEVPPSTLDRVNRYGTADSAAFEAMANILEHEMPGRKFHEAYQFHKDHLQHIKGKGDVVIGIEYDIKPEYVGPENVATPGLDKAMGLTKPKKGGKPVVEKKLETKQSKIKKKTDSDMGEVYSGYNWIKEIKNSFESFKDNASGTPLERMEAEFKRGEHRNKVAKGEFNDLKDTLDSKKKPTAKPLFPGKGEADLKGWSEYIEESRTVERAPKKGGFAKKERTIFETPYGQLIEIPEKMLKKIEKMDVPSIHLKYHADYVNSSLVKKVKGKGSKPSIPKDAIAYKDANGNWKFKEIGRGSQMLAQPHYFFGEIDGVPTVELMMKAPESGTPAWKGVYSFAHDTTVRASYFENEIAGRIADIHKASGVKPGGATDIIVDNLMRKMRFADHRLPLETLMKKPPLKKILSDNNVSAVNAAKLLTHAQELRKVFNDLIRAQNVMREMRGQGFIKFRQAYLPDMFKQSIVHERAWGLITKQLKMKLKTRAFMPDFIKAKKPFNMHEMAKDGNIPIDKMTQGATKLAYEYLPTAVRDIFYTDIMRNNSAWAEFFDKTVKHRGTANALADWSSEVFGGVMQGIDRNVALNKIAAALMHSWRTVLHRTVFPLNLRWTAVTQTSSALLIPFRYGEVATMKGVTRWLSDPAHRKMLQDNTYSWHMKMKSQAGAVYRMDHNQGLLEARKVHRSLADKAQMYTNVVLQSTEGFLTGISQAAAYEYYKSKGHPVNKAFWEKVSEGGAKTQSMYNLEDRPGYIRSQVVRTMAPFQTFSFELFNTIREAMGRTGVPHGTGLRRMTSLAKLLGYAIAWNELGNATVGKRPWNPGAVLPFYQFTFGPILSMAAGDTQGVVRGLPSPVAAAGEFADGAFSWVLEGNERGMRQWMLKYFTSMVGIPGGTQLEKTIDGMIALSQRGHRDVEGEMLFPISGEMEEFRALMGGVYGTKAGQEYLEKRYPSNLQKIQNRYEKKKKKGKKKGFLY